MSDAGSNMARPEHRPASSRALAYTNRVEVTYYLHQGTTKTGKPRYYVAKTVGEGALAEVPRGFEITESINGVVSVRRKTDGGQEAPAGDVALVEAALSRHPHLRGYVARGVGSAVVIFEPHPRPAEMHAFGERSGLAGRAVTGLRQARFEPVMKFEREGDRYVVFRMTYRGKGGWSWPLRTGELAVLAHQLVKTIGTDEFYELL